MKVSISIDTDYQRAKLIINGSNENIDKSIEVTTNLLEQIISSLNTHKNCDADGWFCKQIFYIV